MTTQTDPREAAIQALFTGYLDAHSGAEPDHEAIQAAHDAAGRAQIPSAEIFRAADRRFAKWLLDNIDRH
ncbi:hypothetical protein [Streptomyces sp. NPDC050704]|uniref:hypothetical protein n=1 Tax=Streptomyces sp. NPDC050704 TaxID=3157219 RepID=UPI00343D8360